MTTKQEIEEYAISYAENMFPYDIGGDDDNNGKNALVVDVAKSAAEWGMLKAEERVFDWLYENFYEHPHTTNHICTDIAESMDDLVEQLKKVIEGE